MADIIKVRRSEVGSAIANMSIKPREGEPVYDFYNGKLYLGEGEDASTLAQLNSGEKYMLRWDKVFIDTNKIKDRAINGDKLADGAVTTNKIDDRQVTTAKLADGAVTTDKILNGTITLADLNCTKPSGITTIDAYVDQRAKNAARSGVNVSGARALVTDGGVNITKGNATKPVFFNSGVPSECNTYAGGTCIKHFNGATLSSGSDINYIFAPTSGGTSNYVLISQGSSSAPKWTAQSNLSVGSATNATNATTATKSNQIKIGNKYYTAGFANGVLHFDEV